MYLRMAVLIKAQKSFVNVAQYFQRDLKDMKGVKDPYFQRR
jgi:hypothetical protein